MQPPDKIHLDTVPIRNAVALRFLWKISESHHLGAGRGPSGLRFASHPVAASCYLSSVELSHRQTVLKATLSEAVSRVEK